MRGYVVQFHDVAVAAAQDLFEFAPADDIPIRICGLNLSQLTQAGDANEEFLELKIIRGHSTGGSGGSAGVETPLDSSDAAASFVSEVNNTTIASAGTPVDVFSDLWNIRLPYQKDFLLYPDVDMRPRCDQGDSLIVVRLVAAPSVSMNMSGTCFVAEA